MTDELDGGYSHSVGAHVIYCDRCSRIVFVGLKGYAIPEEQLAHAMDRHLVEFHSHEDIIDI